MCVLNRVNKYLPLLFLLHVGFVNANEPGEQAIKLAEWRFYLGDFKAGSIENQLENPSMDFTFGSNLLFAYSDNFIWGVDFSYIAREFDTPASISGGLFTIVNDDMHLDTLGIAVNGIFKYATGPAEWYAGAGAGLYFSILTIQGSTFGLPGTFEERDTDLGIFYQLGLMFHIAGDSSLGIEYRKLSLDTSLPPVTEGNVDIGGEFVLLSYAVSF